MSIGAGLLLAAAGSVQGQSNDAMARPMPSSGTVTIGTLAAQTPASEANAIFDPMVVPASGCCGSSMGSSVGGGSCGACGGYGRGNRQCSPGPNCPSLACSSHSICGKLFGGICDEFC